MKRTRINEPRAFCDLRQIADASAVFESGGRPYRVLNVWTLPASRVHRVQFADGSEEVVFVKTLEESSAEQRARHAALVEKEFEILTRLKTAVVKEGCYSAVEPLEMVRERPVLITREARGQRLDHLLLNRIPSGRSFRKRMARTLENVGSWLRRFQQATLHRSSNQADYLSSRLKLSLGNMALLRGLPGWEELADPIEEYLGSGVSRLAGMELDVSLCHGDFVMGNLLADESGAVVVLDFTDSAPGLVVTELVAFSQQLGMLPRRRPWSSRGWATELKGALMCGFFADEARPDEPLRTMTVACLVDRALAYTQRALDGGILGRWREKRFVEHCKAELHRELAHAKGVRRLLGGT